MDLYREHILDHYRNPRNYGKMTNPTVAVNELNPTCGDQLHIELQIAGGKVADIKFEGGGCAISLAAASILTERVTGRSVKEAQAISDKEMLDELGVPLSPSRTKCGLLAVSGLRRALKQLDKQFVETD